MKAKIFLLTLMISVICDQDSYSQMFWNQAASIGSTNTSYIAYPNSASLNIIGSFTLEAWVNPSSLTTGTLGIVYKSKTVFKYFLSLDNNGRVRLGSNNVTRLLSKASTALTVNKWSHVAGTYSSSTNTFKIYINGILDTSRIQAGVPPDSNTDSLYIGNAGISSPFSGKLDEVRIWNRELSNSDINRFRLTSLGARGGIYEGLVMSSTFQDANSSGTDYGVTDMSGIQNGGFSRNVTALNLSDNPSNTQGQNECLQLDGSDDYVAGANAAAVSPVTGITLECWVHPLILTACRFISKGSSLTPNYALTMGSVVSAVINGTTFTGAGTPALKQWTHIAFTYSSITQKFFFYMNGLMVDSGTTSMGNITSGNDSIYIGGGPVTITDFIGFMDEVRIANYAKSQNEIVRFMYESIDEDNDPSPAGSSNVVYNLDGLAVDNANSGGPRLFFRNNASFSHSSMIANQPVSPLNRADALNFSESFYLKTSNKRIPSSGITGIAADTLTVNLNETITDVNLYVALNHLNSASLDITLVAPNGDSVKVFDNNTTSGNSDNIVTVFDDNADSSLISGRYVTFSNNIKPVNNIASFFSGDNSQGKWKLRINDVGGNDTGRVFAWGIQINNKTVRDRNLNLSALIQGFFNTSTGLMVPDTLKVTMRNSVAPFAKIDSALAVVKNTGDALVSLKGILLQDNVDYYIQVNHRNSIETWSSAPKKFSLSELNFNFRNTLSNAFQNNMILLANAPSRFGFFSGDENQNGVIDLNDIINISNDAAVFTTGYVSSDINGDNITDLNDLIIAFNNSNNFVSKKTP